MRSSSRLRIALVSIVVGIVAGAPASALAQKSMLRDGEYLKSGEYLVNEAKNLFVIMQGDGNFCGYRGARPASNRGFVYCTQTNGASGAYFAYMQTDGNFCIYRGTGPADNQGNLHCTGRTSPTGRHFAILQNDGNFAIYRGTGPGDNKGLVWDIKGASRLSTGDSFKLFFNDPKTAWGALFK